MSGEGFAFFRWHRMKYPDAACTGHPNNFCRALWEELQGE